MRRAWLATVLVGLGGLASGPVEAALPPAHGGTLTVAADGPLEAWDGALARTDAERLYAEAVHCSVPSLLEAPPTRAGRRVTLRLRPELRFHDGTPLTAEDVVRSLVRLTDPRLGAEAAWRLLAIEGVAERLQGVPALPAVRATDVRTVELDLAVPEVDVAALLDDPRLPVVRRDGRTGCGPFRPAPGTGGAQGRILLPFERHPAGRPFLDRLELRPGAPRGDLVVGDAARESGRPVQGGGTATFLVPERPAPRDLARRTAPVLDRETLARLLAGAGARALHGPQEEPDGAALPDRLTLRYDPEAPAHRAVAERIQLRLYDAGTTVRLVTEGPADLALRRVPVSGEAAALAVEALLRFDGPRAALTALGELARAPEDARADVAARLLSEGTALPLYLEPGYRLAAPSLMGLAPGRATPLRPADLWLWPLSSPPTSR